MSGPWIAAFLVLWAAVILLALLMMGFLRRVSAVLEQAESLARSSNTLEAGLAPGSRVGPFTVRAADGGIVTDADLRGRPTVVIFVEAGCKPCEALAEELSGLEQPPAPVTLFVVTDDTSEGRKMSLGPYARVLYDEEKSASRAFRNSIFPYGFGVDASGVIVERAIATSVEAIHRLGDGAASQTDTLAFAKEAGAINAEGASV